MCEWVYMGHTHSPISFWQHKGGEERSQQLVVYVPLPLAFSFFERTQPLITYNSFFFNFFPLGTNAPTSLNTFQSTKNCIDLFFTFQFVGITSRKVRNCSHLFVRISPNLCLSFKWLWRAYIANGYC